MRWKDINKGYANHVTAMAGLAPHELLGVAADAGPAELKAAYVKMASSTFSVGCSGYLNGRSVA